MASRRKFLKNSALSLLLPSIVHHVTFEEAEKKTSRKPQALKKGDQIAVIAPGGAIFSSDYISSFSDIIENMGYKPVLGKSLRDQSGQFAGTDVDRANELMAYITDTNIKAIIGMRGGSGCARILRYLDFNVIAKHPKIICGFSDITSLVNAIYAQTGLITYHGPVGYSSWGQFTQSAFNACLISGQKFDFKVHKDTSPKTIRGGQAKGHLIGGNLTVFCSLIGTPYMPSCENAILFLEEIDEEPYAIDRNLVHLKQAGILDKLAGIVLGNFKRCVPEHPEKSHSLQKTFDLNLKPLGVPIYSGADFGHTTHKWTLPIGCQAEINADLCRLKVLEPAVNIE